MKEIKCAMVCYAQQLIEKVRKAFLNWHDRPGRKRIILQAVAQPCSPWGIKTFTVVGGVVADWGAYYTPPSGKMLEITVWPGWQTGGLVP
ncbi:hypothetical protein LR032_06560 [Candidatus Bipolaricaulota bacterium]|nr:hypothetical protein [Candidatus Bipolaricaulota bacterium]